MSYTSVRQQLLAIAAQPMPVRVLPKVEPIEVSDLEEWQEHWHEGWSEDREGNPMMQDSWSYVSEGEDEWFGIGAARETAQRWTKRAYAELQTAAAKVLGWF